MTLRLAIFDCDGTMVDSQYSINRCMGAAFASVGLAPPAISQVRRVVGLPLAEAIAQISPESRFSQVKTLAKAYSEAWSKLRQKGALEEPLYEGIEKLIHDISAENWLLAVATGKSSRGLQATLIHHGLEEFFVSLQTADTARGKPDPEMIENVLAATGADRSQTYMIGDTTFDMEMAKAAKVRGVGVSWGYHEPPELREAGAEIVVDSVADLRDVFEL